MRSVMIACALVLFSLAVPQIVPKEERVRLKGLKVLYLAPLVMKNQDGMATKNQMETWAQLRFRSNRVRIVTTKPAGSAYGMVTVRISTVESTNGYFGADIELSVKELCTVNRTKRKQWLTVYDVSAFGSFPKTSLYADSRDVLEEIIDGFCNDYLENNPR